MYRKLVHSIVLAGLVLGALFGTSAAAHADTASCQSRMVNLQARIAAHNALPHTFQVPAQQAQLTAYNAEAARLNAEKQSLMAECRALPAPPGRPALPPAAPKQISGYTEHGMQNRMNRDGHGVNDRALNDAVAHPLTVRSKPGPYGTSFTYRGKDATVVLNSRGQVVTCWPNRREGWRH